MWVMMLVVVVIVVGVVLALRSGATGQGSTLGLWCLVCGLVALLGVAMVGQATFGWVSGFDPPGWLRIVTFWMFPAGVVAAAILGALALKEDSGRAPAVVGLVVGALAAVAFFAVQVSAG
jgi:hypothetical protein